MKDKYCDSCDMVRFHPMLVKHFCELSHTELSRIIKPFTQEEGEKAIFDHPDFVYPTECPYSLERVVNG